MHDRVTGKSLVEEQKRIKGDVDHRIKIQVERKNAKEKLQKERWGQEVLEIEYGQKLGSGDEVAQT